MKKIVLLTLIMTGILLSGFVQKPKDEKFDINLTFKNQEKSGTIYLSVYNSEEDFNNKNALLYKHIKVENGVAEVSIIKNLPKGRYAIICFQDINDNKKLDFHNFMPEEPWGLSNNVQLMGPPAWNDAKFVLNNTKSIEIVLF